MAELAGPIGTGQAVAAGYLENTVALHGSEPLSPVAVLRAPTRALLGVRYLVLPPGMRPGEAHLRPVYDGADARVVEDPAALPRAFVAARARCVDDRAALALLRARAIAPAEEVLLADCASPPAPEPRITAAPEAHITTVPEAALPARPFALTATPSSVLAGDTVEIGVTPRAATGGPWDVYIVWLFSERAAFLGPDGAWAPGPVPFHARLAAGERARGAWNRAAPPADVTLALVMVRPGADPLDRAEWMHRPALAQVRVAAPSDARPSRPWTTLAGLFVAAVAATALAWGRALSTPRPL